ncbi:hypothetical protein [Epilithonimonas caeni]|uniref:hypothetical protein n=1 Tax=Epilithonimonas caeni TaxID=365343 RepID=UPI000422D926|nr:hypothetical protein [Epilithonimonas caeni]
MKRYKIDYYKDIGKVLLIFINIYLFFNYVVNTQLSIIEILGLLSAFIILGYFVYKYFDFQKFIKNICFYLLVILPFIFNVFFFINFTFSEKEEVEKYKFDYTLTSSDTSSNPRKKVISTTIKLNTRKYDDYFFFKTFADYKKIEKNNIVTYTFSKGLFGLRVLKKYEFSKED